MELKVRDQVGWKTEGHGVILRKKGEIVLILEPGEDFFTAVEDLKKRHRFTVIYSGRSVRDHKSYVVLVRDKNMLSRLYWPDVESLRKIYKSKGERKKKEEKK